MSAPMIQVESIGKRYRIGENRDSYGTARDALADGARYLARKTGRAFGASAPATEESRWFTALDDVSFEVEQGDVVAIIGRNGAGKSTLLKILSRITEPTTGRVLLWGRAGSLLEVGTGFHGELTGRENVYLNGAILGMRKREIDRSFDDIVEFAEIGRYLDTPVKRYSSGMMVRLAFAVAAHLEPEILLIDEILAVGDVAFQKKCLGKMSDVAGEGRTVLFVSHNMAVVQALCRRGIVLQDGRVTLDADVGAATASYLRMLDQAASEELAVRTDRRGANNVIVTKIEIVGGEGTRGTLRSGSSARFRFETNRRKQRVSLQFTIFNQLGHPVSVLNSHHRGDGDEDAGAEATSFECVIDELLLRPGRYRMDTRLHGTHGVEDAVEGAAFFEVEDGTVGGRPVSTTQRGGDVVLRHRWLTPPMD